MKQGIHPNYVDCTITCACGNVIHTRDTKPEIHVEVCSKCHPFYTGKQKLVDTGGRVERFKRRFAKSGKQFRFLYPGWFFIRGIFCYTARFPMADYKTIRGTSTFEYEEKRSRFIATAAFADTEEKALAVLNAVRAANRTARHNVYAYVLQNGRTRYSDDGEPAKTAGTPVLETIGHAGVADVIVVVTRYFGGILLGTGGLVRAYTAAASGALQNAELVSMRLVVDCRLRVPYAQFEQAQRIIAAAETRLEEPIFDDAVTLYWRMPAGQEGTLVTALTELTRGGAEVEISEAQYAAF